MTPPRRTLRDIDTPALLIDLPALEANIHHLPELLRGTPCGIRPHVKAHKTPLIARKQIDAGALGVTCSKLGEAEVMVWGGIEHILISTELVGPTKLARLVALARHADLTVVVDGAEPAACLSSTAQRAHVEL